MQHTLQRTVQFSNKGEGAPLDTATWKNKLLRMCLQCVICVYVYTRVCMCMFVCLRLRRFGCMSTRFRVCIREEKYTHVYAIPCVHSLSVWCSDYKCSVWCSDYNDTHVYVIPCVHSMESLQHTATHCNTSLT